MSKFAELKFVRVTGCESFGRIPRYLFEQMRYREFDVSRLYEFAGHFLPSPQTWFYTLVNNDYEVKGVLWATTEPVQNVLIINMVSVDKEYQGGAIEAVTEFLIKEIKKTSLEPKIYWINKRHKYLSKLGWENTGKVMMKYQER